MNIVDIIEKKKLKNEHTKEEIDFLIDSVMNQNAEDYQISAWLMAVCCNGLSDKETVYLTDALIKSGEIIDFTSLNCPIVDKHSTGGVGDKVTLILVPLLGACGLMSVKLSGKGLGHTGGTIDKLESIPGFNTILTIDQIKTQAQKVGAAIAAQSSNLTPADGKLYALRDVTSTIDNLSLICASVVSKKIASGANHIIIDVKYGSGAFVKTIEKAQELGSLMERTAKALNHNIIAITSPMEEPLGANIGNSLEVIESIEFLKGNMEKDLKDVVFEIATIALIETGKVSNIQEAHLLLEEKIKDKSALEKLKQIIESQGGNSKVIEDYSLFPQASIKLEIKAEKDGVFGHINALSIAKAAKILGAGRNKKTDPIDYSAGVIINKKTDIPYKKGETLITLYTNDSSKAQEALLLLKKELSI